MMLPGERRACLDALHWSQRQLAAILGLPEGQVRRWFRDDRSEVPPEVDAWLYRRAKAALLDPPPTNP
jgi:transcriptional regulator with XRE-family HTH domain